MNGPCSPSVQIPNPKSQAPNPKLRVWDSGFGIWDLTRASRLQLFLSLDPVIEVSTVIAAALQVTMVGGLGDFIVGRVGRISVPAGALRRHGAVGSLVRAVRTPRRRRRARGTAAAGAGGGAGR